ncbi:hypothetical protein OpiT1DRAFT_03955 [Opitutaceae bacterium TAV1]|nr:hypothetical protein OpiT1DRAFT_03955 [Opitutaceae bacterium TAV1]
MDDLAGAGSLHFAFMVSHILGDPEDTKLASYREAARAFAARLPDASLVDLSQLVPYAEMVSQKYYDKGCKAPRRLGNI